MRFSSSGEYVRKDVAMWALLNVWIINYWFFQIFKKFWLSSIIIMFLFLPEVLISRIWFWTYNSVVWIPFNDIHRSKIERIHQNQREIIIVLKIFIHWSSKARLIIHVYIVNVVNYLIVWRSIPLYYIEYFYTFHMISANVW